MICRGKLHEFEAESERKWGLTHNLSPPGVRRAYSGGLEK